MFGPSFQDKKLGFEGCSVKGLIVALGVGLVLIFRFLLDLGRCGAFCVGFGMVAGWVDSYGLVLVVGLHDSGSWFLGFGQGVCGFGVCAVWSWGRKVV